MTQESPILKGQLFTKGPFSVGHGFGLAGLFFHIKIHTRDLDFIPGAILLSPELLNTQISIVHN